MHRFPALLRCFLLLMISSAALAGAGSNPEDLDRIELSVSATREIANDLAIAVLYVEREGKRQTEVAGQINEAMTWALGLAKAGKQLKLQTLQYSTWPIYGTDASVINGWRARQNLRIESSDPAELGELIARLQERLAVESVGFAVSRARREAMEDELTSEVLARFQARSSRIAKDLGRSGYRLVRISLGGQGERPEPVLYARAAPMAEMNVAATPAALESGVQNLSLTATGTIALTPSP